MSENINKMPQRKNSIPEGAKEVARANKIDVYGPDGKLVKSGSMDINVKCDTENPDGKITVSQSVEISKK